MSIYVGNLSFKVTEADLTAVFAEYGSVKRVQIPTDRETGRIRGFGFVEMSSEAEEQAAIAALDGAEWMGRDLKVNKARPREERPTSGFRSGNANSGGESIYVGNLSFEVTEADLTAVFAEYGSVKRVQIPTDRETGRTRGFGFVEMSSEAEGQAAIAALDGAEWMGRDLKVNKARPREERPTSDFRSGNANSGGERRRSFQSRY